ncbi:hypothetical protein Poli38472_003145 [Pythium oligandrum]|uniref:Uncharacterized protein n=1 Tax=Pythium oligandrum TaxID=41045 RepID=A0A8K1C6A1_PYTOL|nr:hypothetical protein Poli38472_003145 [Pythium oligandrum]|eukprot:TMW57220.1 hypothetical protein Poli38472_003145 [Pythium oligandrum]
MSEPPTKIPRLGVEEQCLPGAPESTAQTVRDLLQVPLVFPYSGRTKFYVRSCYPQYYLLIEKVVMAKVKKCITLTGSPGIGKSVFYTYFCDLYRERHPTTWVIAAAFLRGKHYKIETIEALERAIRENKLEIKSEDKSNWTRAVNSWEANGQPQRDAKYGEAISKIPQYVCTWEH